MYCKQYLKHILFVVVAILLFAACTSKKQLVYLQSATKDADSTQLSVPAISPYQIKVGDRIYILVSSIDPQTNAIFQSSSSNTLTSEASIDLVSYQVREDGKVNYPFIGEITVADKTLLQVQQDITQKVQALVPQASVVVKMVNRSITVLGEVRRPGRYTVFKDQMTIFEALGFAGDITDYGSRKRVKIVRKMGSEQKVWNIDLTQEQLLADAHMMVQPSDIIYVEPTSKVYGKKTFSTAIVLSAISTFVALYATFLK